MKVVAYTALHYGREYLGSAIRSIIDHVDEYYVLYSAKPSYGFPTDATCPESRDELYAIAMGAAGWKLRWHDGEWNGEGQHRDTIYTLAPDADVILVVDADEVWSSNLARIITDNINYDMMLRYIRLPMVHFWRSFYRAVIHDPAYPVRVIQPKRTGGETTFPRDWAGIAHMGYAQSPAIVQYKWRIHGHQNQLRQDVDWFNDVYLNKERTTDLHPVGSEYWNWECVNPLDYLPAWMVEHKYFGLNWID